MANKIEIFENTLLQLITRQGTNTDRVNVKLKSGELGYTTDTKRLYVGDGSTQGGILIGNKFKGSAVDITTLGVGSIGDIAYDSDNNKLYVITSGNGTIFSNWQEIGGVYTAGDGSIRVTNTNKIFVQSLSAGTVSRDLLGKSITLNNTNRITLSSTIAVDKIETAVLNSHLELPKFLNINNVDYNFPVGGLGNNKYLKTDAAGNLAWGDLGSNVNYFTFNSGGILPVGTVISTLTSSSLNTDWVMCNGQSLPGVDYPDLSAVIGTTYGGNNINFNVPNLNQKILYGTSSSPYMSNLYDLVSSTSSDLQATGVNFFIKAKADVVVNGSLKVSTPLKITTNGNDQTNSQITVFDALRKTIELDIQPTAFKVNDPLYLKVDSIDKSGTYVNSLTGNLEIGITDAANTLFTNTFNLKVESPLRSTLDGSDTSNTNMLNPKTNVVIKAPSNTLTVLSPLSVIKNGITKTGEAISPYDGNITISKNRNYINVEYPLNSIQNSALVTGDVDLDDGAVNISLNTNQLYDVLYPIGSILFTYNNINPSSTAPLTTWVSFSLPAVSPLFVWRRTL